MWTYNQVNGVLAHDGQQVAIGYSGHPPHVNDAGAEDIKGVGPIPRGYWTFGEAVQHPALGWAIPLVANIGTETFGRSGFWCHGDEIEQPGQGLASDGCMIMNLTTRVLINSDLDKELNVV